MRFIFRTDVHAADKNPVSWKGDYSEEIFGNLEQIGELAREHKVTAVLDGGDFFHVKSAVRNSHGLVYRTVEVHRDYPCPVYSVEGNHDITGNNLGTIDHQPLGVLYASGVFQHLREQVFEEDDFRVRVVGVPYSSSLDLREVQERLRRKPGDDFMIAVMHVLAAEDPPAHVEEFFGEPVFRYSSLILEDGPDVFCFGHWHKDQGIVELGGRFFVNQGAVSRGALTQENIDRIPKVALIDAKNRTVTAIPLRVPPAEDVFDFERKDRQDQENQVIKQFVSELEASINFDASQSIEANILALNFAPEVRTRALEYLEKVRS